MILTGRNKLNNSIENLEWCTQSENIKHSFKFGLNKSSKRIYCNEIKKKFNSLADASRELNVPTSNICVILKGKRKSIHGYSFVYLD